MNSLNSFSYKPYQFASRRGFLCFLVNELGQSLVGEAAPLPYFSEESYEEVELQLQSIQNTLSYDESTLLPSVHFALTESIDLKTISLPPTQVHGFLYGDYESILKKAAICIQEGFTHVKLKTWELSFEETSRVLEYLTKHFTLRVDANCQYTMDDAQKIFTPFIEKIEYIEEPYENFNDLENCPFPFALDESLRTDSRNGFNNPNLKAFLIKASLMGGRNRYQDLLKFASEKGVEVLMGPAFETGIGLLQMLKMQSEIGGTIYPLGLSTLGCIHNDALRFPLNQLGPHLYMDIPCSSLKTNTESSPLSV